MTAGGSLPGPEVFRALGDPVRWELVLRIAAAGEISGAALDKASELAKSTLSHHLRILSAAGVVITRRQGRTHIHSLDRAVLSAASSRLAGLLSDPSAPIPAPTQLPRHAEQDLPTW